MALGTQTHVIALLWSNLLASQSQAQYLRDNTGKSTIKYSIINLNGEQVTLSWNATQFFSDRNVTMFYRFDEHVSKQCPQYILDQGYHTGCHFKTEGEDLYISIKDTAGKELYFDEQDIRMFFKPKPPENVTFHWAEDNLTVQCSPLQPPHCFVFELQYKSTLNQDWKSRKGRCCKIEEHEFDPERCYSFRLRLERSESCNRIAYFSEWGAETLWKNGSSIGSCDMKSESKAVILLTSVMATILVAFALLMGVCRLERIRRNITPVIPDPKHFYSDLFSDHNGNFQDWLFKTENVLVQPEVEYEEEECVIEEQEVEEDTRTEKIGSPRESSLRH